MTPTPSPHWDALRQLAEALRHAPADIPAAHGMGHVFCTRTYGLRNVCLDNPTLVLVLEGEKRHAGTEKAQHLCPAPGLLLLPADTPLHVENIPDAHSGRYLAYCLGFEPALLENAARHWPVPAGASGLPPSAPCGEGQAVEADETLLSTLRLLLAATLEQVQGAQPCPQLLRLQCEQILLLLALRGWGPHLLTRRNALVGEALRLIQRQPHLPWTLDMLAEQLHCGSRTLRRRLHEEGRTLREMLRHARLHTALGLLQQQRCTVSEAAFSCGYDSPSRFSRRFQEHFGLLPSELLRSGGSDLAARGASLA